MSDGGAHEGGKNERRFLSSDYFFRMRLLCITEVSCVESGDELSDIAVCD